MSAAPSSPPRCPVCGSEPGPFGWCPNLSCLNDQPVGEPRYGRLPPVGSLETSRTPAQVAAVALCLFVLAGVVAAVLLNTRHPGTAPPPPGLALTVDGVPYECRPARSPAPVEAP